MTGAPRESWARRRGRGSRPRHRRLAPAGRRCTAGAGARTFARPRANVPPPHGLVRRGALGDRAPSRAHRRWAPPRYRPPCRRRGRPGPGPARLGGERTDHVHVKDVRREVLESVIADRADMTEAWRRGVFCELGAGDVDLEFFLAALAAGGYSGWARLAANP